MSELDRSAPSGRAGPGGTASGRWAVSGDETSRYSRREFIKRVIASGAAASASTYIYGGLSGCSTRGQSVVAGGVERLLSLDVNGEVRRVDVLPQETLAMTLRYK